MLQSRLCRAKIQPVKYHDMNRVALIERIKEARTNPEELLQSAPLERYRFVAHLYQSRIEYLRTCETAGKSGKEIERCVIATFQIAQSMALTANFVNGSTFCGLVNSR